MNIAEHSARLAALETENALLLKRALLAEEAARAAAEKLDGLAHELSQLKRLVFGAKSERFEPAATADQLPLFLTAGSADVPAVEVALRPKSSGGRAPAVHGRGKPVRQELPSHLPREVIVIEPEVDRAGLRKIGSEVTETLDYRPAKLIVIRRERPKYVDPRCEERGVIVAPLPPRPIEKGIAEAGLLANVLIEKYVDHLPLYRQVQRFMRQGITLATSTLGDWTAASAELLTPLYEALITEARASGYIQADETPIAVQDPERRSPIGVPQQAVGKMRETVWQV